MLDDTPISDGIRYARNQRVGLARFIEDGRLPIHNNMSELELRREAIGRKNWLFVGSDEGGEVNARFVSLLASCRLCARRAVVVPARHPVSATAVVRASRPRALAHRVGPHTRARRCPRSARCESVPQRHARSRNLTPSRRRGSLDGYR